MSRNHISVLGEVTVLSFMIHGQMTAKLNTQLVATVGSWSLYAFIYFLVQNAFAIFVKLLVYLFHRIQPVIACSPTTQLKTLFSTGYFFSYDASEHFKHSFHLAGTDDPTGSIFHRKVRCGVVSNSDHADFTVNKQ